MANSAYRTRYPLVALKTVCCEGRASSRAWQPTLAATAPFLAIGRHDLNHQPLRRRASLPSREDGAPPLAVRALAPLGGSSRRQGEGADALCPGLGVCECQMQWA